MQTCAIFDFFYKVTRKGGKGRGEEVELPHLINPTLITANGVHPQNIFLSMPM